jgi:hypothetical protein
LPKTRVNTGLTLPNDGQYLSQAAPGIWERETMLKTFFITREPENTVDIELERTMQSIHNRMQRMLEAEEIKRHRFSSFENTPSYYRS